MQFREQGRQIQCIRSIYNSETKRCHQKVVAALDRAADEVPAALVAGLTAAEQQQLALWFEARRAAKAEKLQREQVENAALILAQLSEAVKAKGEVMSENAAALAWEALRHFSKVLRKTGHHPQRKTPQTREMRPS